MEGWTMHVWHSLTFALHPMLLFYHSHLQLVAMSPQPVTRSWHSHCRCTSHAVSHPNGRAPPAVSTRTTELDDWAESDATPGTCPANVHRTPCLMRSRRTDVRPNHPLRSQTSSSAQTHNAQFPQSLCIAPHEKSTSELQSISCHIMGSQSVNRHTWMCPTLTSVSQADTLHVFLSS